MASFDTYQIIGEDSKHARINRGLHRPITVRDSLNIHWNVFEFFRYLNIKAINSLKEHNRLLEEKIGNVLAMEQLTHGKILQQAKEHGEEEFGDFTHIYESFERINGTHIPLQLFLETV